MRTVQLLLLSTIFFFAATAAGYAADVAKIGVVDFQKILTTSTAGKKAQIEINAKGKNMEQELKTKGDAINKQKETFEREALVMSKPMREQQERELRILINDFKSMQKTYMNDFKQFERRLVSRIRDEILTLVTEKAKKEGFLMVVERREGGLLYFPSTMDLTDDIIRTYNANFEVKTGSGTQTGTQ